MDICMWKLSNCVWAGTPCTIIGLSSRCWEQFLVLETSLQNAGADLRSVHVRGACPGFREVALMGWFACVGRLWYDQHCDIIKAQTVPSNRPKFQFQLHCSIHQGKSVGGSGVWGDANNNLGVIVADSRRPLRKLRLGGVKLNLCQHGFEQTYPFWLSLWTVLCPAISQGIWWRQMRSKGERCSAVHHLMNERFPLCVWAASGPEEETSVRPTLQAYVHFPLPVPPVVNTKNYKATRCQMENVDLLPRVWLCLYMEYSSLSLYLYVFCAFFKHRSRCTFFWKNYFMREELVLSPL